MNITIENRMDSIEQQLKELRKEMEESVARYKAVDAVGKSYPFTHGDISKFRSGQIGDTEEAGFIPMTAQEWSDHCKKVWEEIKLEYNNENSEDTH